jgi:hypothetical protein
MQATASTEKVMYSTILAVEKRRVLTRGNDCEM